MPSLRLRVAGYALAGTLVVALCAVVVLVLVSANVRNVREGCFRATQDRVDNARRSAADAMREDALADTPGESARQAHRDTARVAASAASNYLRRAGFLTIPDLERIAALDPESGNVRELGRVFCRRAFPTPP